MKNYSKTDKTAVKIPKREVERDFSSVPLFDINRYLTNEPTESIAPLQRGYDIPEYSPFVENLSSNVEGASDIVSPLDDIYEASGGNNPYINTALDMIGPAEALAAAKGAATFIPLLKQMGDPSNTVRLYHGSAIKGKQFIDPLEKPNVLGSSYGQGLYQGETPAKGRFFAKDFMADVPTKTTGSIYAFDYPVNEFREKIYRPILSEDKMMAPQYLLSAPTEERLKLQELVRSLGGRDRSFDGAAIVDPYNMDISADRSIAIAKALRERGIIGAGPYRELQAPEYVMYEARQPSWEIQLDAKDYPPSRLGSRFDTDDLFNEYIERNIGKYIKGTEVK